MEMCAMVMQSYMDSEIRAIMAQYMPLDSQNEVHNHTLDDEPWARVDGWQGRVPLLCSSE